jgi:curved DNA-binding protein CbpA
MTYYAVLGVPENADSEAIHDAYRARARQYHPDAGEGSSAGKFREVAEAYETLADPARRKAYDATLAHQRTPRQSIVVEPLAQPWFSSRPSSIRPMRSMLVDDRFVDDSFEETFRAFDRLLASLWFGRW